MIHGPYGFGRYWQTARLGLYLPVNRYRIPIRGQVVDLSRAHRKFIGNQDDPRT
jgi:hypothetical protein